MSTVNDADDQTSFKQIKRQLEDHLKDEHQANDYRFKIAQSLTYLRKIAAGIVVESFPGSRFLSSGLQTPESKSVSNSFSSSSVSSDVDEEVNPLLALGPLNAVKENLSGEFNQSTGHTRHISSNSLQRPNALSQFSDLNKHERKKSSNFVASQD